MSKPFDDLQEGSIHTLTKALSATTSGVLITDPTRPDNPIIYANLGFERMTGYGRDEVIGQNCRFLQGQDTSREKVAELRTCIKSGSECKVTLRNYRRDGTPFWNELSISPVYEGERLTHFIGIQTDVTDRESAAQLQTALLLAESIYETVREPLLILDRDLRVFRTNRAFYRLFGTTPEATEGCLLYELGDHEWDIPALRTLLEGILPTKNPFDDFEMAHEFANLGHRTMILNARRLDKEGLPEFILLAMEDASERKRYEQQILQRNEELAGRDRAKDEFLAMLSHELRNPLNAIAGALYLAAPLAEEHEEIAYPLSVAQRQVENMTALIGDLLEVSRITQGKLELKTARVSLGEILTAAVQSGETKLGIQDRVKIRSDIVPDVWVQADPLRLEQVFSNLVGNAIKFTAEGRIRVRLAVENGMAVVEVGDTGVGIDAAVLPHVFDLFRQGERTLARSEGGLGIGLTIAQQLVKLHGGTIEASSEGAGRGTVFTVRLPLAEGSPAPFATEPQPEPRRTAASTALVVDDNRDGADMLVKLLGRQGYTAKAVYHGDDVIDAVRDLCPDVAFLDIGLPGKDGYQLAEEIRADAALRRTRLVALTGYGQEEDRERAREAGFDIHLLKPLSIAALKDALLQLASKAD